MQVNIRGGTHYEYSFLPGNTLPYPFGTATLRGEDVAAWYSTAWFDRYVKCQGRPSCEANADARLETDRWRDDSTDARIDPSSDPNLYSFYLRSRYALREASGTKVACDDMRAGCSSMSPDGLAPDYSFVADANRPDGPRRGRVIPCSVPQAGGREPDVLRGTDAGDALRGRGGNDRLSGAPGRTAFTAERAATASTAGPAATASTAGPARDRLLGGRGADVILATGAGADRVHCGAGHDTARVGPGDTVRGCERVIR